MKKLTNTEFYEIAQKVDNEGFFYYMAYYGPDYNAIKKLGFDVKSVEEAVKLLVKLDAKFTEGLDVELPDDYFD